MKLGTRELYQPIQSNKSVAVPRQDSMSPALGISNKSVAVRCMYCDIATCIVIIAIYSAVQCMVECIVI